jgi:hypothetical protein
MLGFQDLMQRILVDTLVIRNYGSATVYVTAPYHPCNGSPRTADRRWLHEIKHDGFRLIARREGERVVLRTRGGGSIAAHRIGGPVIPRRVHRDFWRSRLP